MKIHHLSRFTSTASTIIEETNLAMFSMVRADSRRKPCTKEGPMSKPWSIPHGRWPSALAGIFWFDRAPGRAQTGVRRILGE